MKKKTKTRLQKVKNEVYELACKDEIFADLKTLLRLAKAAVRWRKGSEDVAEAGRQCKALCRAVDRVTEEVT